jgi:hypothetical protein
MLRQRFQVWFPRTCPVACLLFVAAIGIHAAPQASGYHVIRRMPVGGDGNWDYLRVDPDAQPNLHLARHAHDGCG